MAFVVVNPGDPIQAHQLDQVINALNGTAGGGQPVLLVALNDATNYALTAQNLDGTNQRALNVLNAAGTSMVRVDSAGVTLGSPLNLPNNSVTSAAIADGGIQNVDLGPDVARANMLVNPGFEIWQRGSPLTLAAGNAYGPDRWGVSGAGTGTATLTRDTTNQDTGSGACCAFTFNYTAGTALVLQQPLVATDYPQLRGVTVSLSMRVRTSVANLVRIGIYDGSAWHYSAYHSGNGAYQTLTIPNISLSASATSWLIGAWFDNSIGGTAYLDNAMLVVGSQPANYVPLHPADDLARCLRYYENLTVVDQLAYGPVAGAAFGHEVAFKAIKPVVPTTTTYALTLTNCTVSVDRQTSTGCRWYITITAAGAAEGWGGLYVEANP